MTRIDGENLYWGQTDGRCWQGWAKRYSDRRYWQSHDSDYWNTLERGGPLRYENHAWISDGSASFPFAVMDDYGFLVPVPAHGKPY